MIVAASEIPGAVSDGLTIGIGIYLVIIAGAAGIIVPWLPIEKK